MLTKPDCGVTGAYRGKIRVVVSGKALRMVNYVSLEAYLRGEEPYTDYFITNNYDQPPGMYLSSDVILMIILGSFSIPLILYVLLTRLEVLQRLKMRSD